ncbi:MAG: ArnT family glycosyltransferase [Janthinobacterium lividum]
MINPDKEEIVGSPIGAAAFAISTLIFIALCVSVLRHSVIWLLGFVADDAFYYLQIARHLAVSGHSTFDGLNPTNGYHPGWMLLMTGCARLFPDRIGLLRASLGLEFGFQFATSLMLIPIMRRFAGPFWAWVVAAAWLLSPLPFTLALFGVEAPFAQFTVAVAVWVYLKHISPFLRPGTDFRPPTGSLVVFGLSLALAFYGRTDQALLAVAAFATLLGLIRLWTAPSLRLSASARMLLWAGGAFFLGILPWYVFSYVSCGTLTQDSGAIKLLWYAHDVPFSYVHARISGAVKFTALFWLAAPFAALMTGQIPDFLSHATIVFLGLVVVAGTLWWFNRRSPATDGEMRSGELADLGQVTLWLGSAYLISGLVYGALLGDSQLWHLAIPSLISFLLLTSWGIRLARQHLGQKVQMRVGLVLLTAVLGLCAWHRESMLPSYPWQRDVYKYQPRFEALVPASARIGCFDAGIPAYFSPHTVVNLDGLVNHTAVAYWKTSTLERYVAVSGINYIANDPGTVAHAQKFTGTPIPLTLIATSPLTDWYTNQRCFWKVGSRPEKTTSRLKDGETR